MARFLSLQNLQLIWYKLRKIDKKPYKTFKMRIHEKILEIVQVGFIIFAVIHTAACIFIFLGQVSAPDPNWIAQFCENCLSQWEIYFRAIYYCVVTMATVGYGDVYPTNSVERSFAIVWMLFGIAFYAFLISFTNKLLTPKTSPATLLFKKANKLDKIILNNSLDPSLETELKEAIKYSSGQISYRWLQGETNIIQEMPIRMQCEFFQQIHP